MNESWAVSLPSDKALWLGPLRLRQDIKASLQGETLWLRGEHLEKDLEWALRKLPGAQRYAIFADGRLRPVSKRIPQGQLPPGPWSSLATLLPLSLPVAAFPGQCPSPIALRLLRTTEEAEPTVLLTTMTRWVAYATTAPQVRLRPLRFALSAEANVLIQGNPLPPLAGQRYVERCGIAVPCGWSWSPGVGAEVLQSLLELATGDLALLAEDGSSQRIEKDHWVPATRSAVRLSQAVLLP